MTASVARQGMERRRRDDRIPAGRIVAGQMLAQRSDSASARPRHKEAELRDEDLLGGQGAEAGVVTSQSKPIGRQRLQGMADAAERVKARFGLRVFSKLWRRVHGCCSSKKFRQYPGSGPPVVQLPRGFRAPAVFAGCGRIQRRRAAAVLQQLQPGRG